MQCAPRRARARNRVPRLLFPLAWDNSKLSKREQIYFFLFFKMPTIIIMAI